MKKETIISAEDIKQYLFLEDNIDELGWDDSKIDTICRHIVDISLKLKIIDKDDLQKYGREIDYGSTANDTVVYMSDDEKNRILSQWKKIN